MRLPPQSGQLIVKACPGSWWGHYHPLMVNNFPRIVLVTGVLPDPPWALVTTPCVSPCHLISPGSRVDHFGNWDNITVSPTQWTGIFLVNSSDLFHKGKSWHQCSSLKEGKAVEILMVWLIESLILHSSTGLDELKQHESSKEKPS